MGSVPSEIFTRKPDEKSSMPYTYGRMHTEVRATQKYAKTAPLLSHEPLSVEPGREGQKERVSRQQNKPSKQEGFFCILNKRKQKIVKPRFGAFLSLLQITLSLYR